MRVAGGSSGHCLAWPARQFRPSMIVLAKWSNATEVPRRLSGRICAAYQETRVVEAFGVPRSRVAMGETDALRFFAPLDVQERMGRCNCLR